MRISAAHRGAGTAPGRAARRARAVRARESALLRDVYELEASAMRELGRSLDSAP
ncbi:MAG: hypothetical protein ABI895_14050 [Deltaproteobacteria bacterium]